MDEFMAVPHKMTPERVQKEIQALRRCQFYLGNELCDGPIKDDFKKAVDMAFDLIGEILEEHGIEEFEDRVKFEDGNFEDWRD